MTSKVDEAFDYMVTQLTLLNAAAALQGIDFDRFIEKIDRADLVAPYMDPTLYLRNRAAGDPLATMRAIAVAAKTLAGAMPKSCRVCGCTNENACEGGCSWIAPGLCSTCAPEPSPRR
jgi:hypothetical protein